MTPTAKRPSGKTRQRGSILAFTGMALLTLVGMTVVGVDVGRLAFTASEVQTIADGAANAYMKQTLRVKAGVSGETPENAAGEVVEGNNVDGDWATDANIEAFIPGTWNTTTHTFTPGGAQPNAVKADATATVNNLFATLVGVPTTKVDRSATAAAGCPDSGHVLPLAVGDCMFEAFQNSGSCSDLPKLFQQPGDNSCWTNLSGSPGGGADFIQDMLPASCCKNASVCGGGEASPGVGVGSVIDMINGQIASLLPIIEDCIADGTNKFVVPVVKCQSGTLNCSSSAEIVGFASVELVSVSTTGSPKEITLSAFCNTDAPVIGVEGECFGTETIALVQ